MKHTLSVDLKKFVIEHGFLSFLCSALSALVQGTAERMKNHGKIVLFWLGAWVVISTLAVALIAAAVYVNGLLPPSYIILNWLGDPTDNFFTFFFTVVGLFISLAGAVLGVSGLFKKASGDPTIRYAILLGVYGILATTGGLVAWSISVFFALMAYIWFFAAVYALNLLVVRWAKRKVSIA